MAIFRRIGGVLALALLLATPASASYEQVGNFEVIDGESPINYATGVAINTTGAGGVPAGTVHAVTFYASKFSEFGGGVLRYSPQGKFLGAWGKFGGALGVAVDQTTGNVYVLRNNVKEGEDVVQVYSPDGSKLITSFGEWGVAGETIDKGPEKIHSWQHSGIAVDDSGTVYVSDGPNNGDLGSKWRIMVFEPQSPGDYEHYVYAGRSQDIAVSYESVALALDSAGNLYTVIREEDAIYQFAPGEPASPACEFQRPSGGIEGVTVDPQRGKVFYYTNKTEKIHQLNACNAEGKFIETDSVGMTPKPSSGGPYPFAWGLAFNPSLAWEASRPAGALYVPTHSGLGYILAPAEIHPPSVESQSVSSVGISTATFGAQINPKGSPTRYAFQYITEAAYQENEPAERFAGATEAPLGGAVLGSGQEALSAGVSLVGLEPDTAYRYRVIATSHCDPEEEELCEDVGDAQAFFRTFPAESPGLPDDRAYELVSPAQKSGGQVIPADSTTGSCGIYCKPAGIGFPMQSAPDGNAIVYSGQPFSFTEGASQFNQYLSKRTVSGWQTTILSPFLLASGSGHKAFNAELTQGLLSQGSPSLSPEAPSEYDNLYTQPTSAPSSLTPLIRSEPPNRNPALTYAGASADFSRLFFEANDALTGETPFAPEALDPGPPTASDTPMNLYESVGGELRLVNVLPGNAETVTGSAFGSPAGDSLKANLSHAISDDGSRVFWSDEAGQVYVRENAESTRAIPDPGEFLTASADGSKLLLDNGHIYDLETGEPTPQEIADLSQGEGGFQGIAGQNDDLSRIYFVATAVLTGEEENEEGAKAQAGKPNLYAWDEGAVAFIATLLPGDINTAAGAQGTWLAPPVQRTAEASPDGRWVAFRSSASLTGYDNVGPECVPSGSEKGKLFLKGPCPEVFLYDSATAELSCPSCNPTGARPLGRSVLRLISNAKGSLPQPRYLTNEGRLYFDSRDSLSPFDTNKGVEDVYQYEPEGVGSCTREGGCVSLISAGHEPVDSNFLAADATGKNVFFTTRDQLLLKDRDELIDLYVAREGGGIPAETEAVEPVCQGEACQPAVVLPNDPTPASSSYEGAENVVEKKVAKKAKRKKRKQRAQKRRHKRPHERAAKHNRRGTR